MIAGIFRRVTSKPFKDIKSQADVAQTAKEKIGENPRLATHAKTVAASAIMEAMERSIAPVKIMPVRAKPARVAGAMSGPMRARIEVKELPSFRKAKMTISKMILLATRNAMRRRTDRPIRLNTRAI